MSKLTTIPEARRLIHKIRKVELRHHPVYNGSMRVKMRGWRVGDDEFWYDPASHEERQRAIKETNNAAYKMANISPQIKRVENANKTREIKKTNRSIARKNFIIERRKYFSDIDKYEIPRKKVKRS